MIDPEFAQAFAQEWVAAWNTHDLDRILSHYTEDFEMTSPLIVQRLHEPSGTLRGKTAVRPYWRLGLGATPLLRFELMAVLVSVNSLTILYRRTSGQMAAEMLIFNDRRQVIKGIAHYEAHVQ